MIDKTLLPSEQIKQALAAAGIDENAELPGNKVSLKQDPEKRGVDIAKVEELISREQERDLRFLYRFDQIRLFDPVPSDQAKAYNYKRKPSDPVTIQNLFEIRDMYLQAKADGDSKTAQLYLKMIAEISSRAEDRRDKVSDRLFGWKRHQEDKDKREYDPQEVMRLANG